MTQINNAAYDLHRTALSQQPIYIIERAWNDGQPGTENTNDVYFSTADISKINNAPSWLASRYFPVLRHDSISAITEKIDEKNGTSSIGSMSYEVVDKNGIVSDILRRAEADTGQSSRRQRDELYVMFAGMDWADRIKVRTLNVYDMVFDSNKSIYKFTSQSLLKWMKKDVFVPKTTTLSANVTSSTLTIPLIDSTAFLLAVNHSAYGPVSYGFVKINDEIMMWKANAANTLTIETGGRGMFGTTAAAHSQGDDVQEVCVLRGNPYVIALRVLTSTGIGFSNGIYDILPEHWGLNINQTDIHIDDWLSVGALRTGLSISAGVGQAESGIEFEFVYSDPEQGKVFVEREILRNTGSFGRVLGDGTYSCKAFNLTPQPSLDPATGRISTAAGIQVLTEDDIIKISPLKANMQKMSSGMDLEYFPRPRDGTKMIRRARFVDMASRTRHGDSPRTKYSIRGAQTDSASVAALFTFFNGVQSRFSSPPVECTVELRPEHETIEVGDIVGVDILEVQDVVTTDRKWAAATKFRTGNIIMTPSGALYQSAMVIAGTIEGTTGATEPNWGASAITDNGIVWNAHDGHLARAFEVMSTSINIKNGNPKLSLVSQPEVPAWWTPTIASTAARFDDLAYQVGTDLSTMAGWAASGGVCSSTANNTLPAGDYYYVGDIKIKHAVSISGTVRIWCTGSVTDVVGASINGLGDGLPGGVGTIPSTVVSTTGWLGTLDNTNGTRGGFVGIGGNGGNNRYNGRDMSKRGFGGLALHTQGVRLNIVGTNADPATGKFRTISGVPASLDGSGSGSGGAISYPFPFGIGANGVKGGAGFSIIARGINIINTTIDLRGANGLNGVSAGGTSGQSGSGGGGGGTLALLMENDGLGGSPIYGAGSTAQDGKIKITGGAGGVSVGYYQGYAPQPGGPGDIIVQVF